MFGLGRKKPDLVERPENEPKMDLHNKTDRKLILTLMGVGLAALAVLGGLIVLYYVLWQ